MAVDDKNVEGVEVGVMLADLDSSCLGSLSDEEGSAVECSPPCNLLHYSCFYKL